MTPHLGRGAELRMKGHLYEIREMNDEVLGGRQGYPMAEKGYKRTLQEVIDCATVSQMDDVADYVKERIRENEERPPNRKIRKAARRIVSEAGHPASSYLNRA